MQPQSINVNTLIDESRVGGLQITVFILCSLCLLLDGFDVQAMGYVAPAVTQEWKISPAALGNVFGAAPFGVLIGSLLFSMIADKVGRRPVLIGLTLYFAIATLLTARADTPGQLLVIRFLAGIGLGGIMPNAVALVGEYSPLRSRVLIMMVVGNFFSAGAAIGGFLAAWLIPNFGWRSVFYFGGAIPLAVALAMWVALPESLPFLALRRKSLEQARRWVQRLNPALKIEANAELVGAGEPGKGVPIVQLFRAGRAFTTLGLWVINFMNLLNLYFLSNWLPTLVRDAGHSTQTAVLMGATLQLAGTVGALLLSWVIRRAGFVPALAVGFTCGAAAIAWIGQPGLSLSLLYSAVAIAGIGVVGGQSGVNALAATIYPTGLRSTGVGAGLGVGRIGAIVGPVVGGQLLALHWQNEQLFLAAAVPAAISALVMAAMRWALPRKS
jgi:AAHS family 4-hydroxybenzoate transporter-like MFS transporter